MAREYQYHPAANIFPIMEHGELKTLADDIAANGLITPIELFDGKVIDGRNRLLACQLADVDPEFTEVDCEGLEPDDYAISLNLKRRHLTLEQKAFVAARRKTYHAELAKQRQGTRTDIRDSSPGSPTGKASDAAGAELGVSGKTVDRAEKVLEQGSAALVKAAERGEVSVSTAAKLAAMPKGVQAKAVKGGTKEIKRILANSSAGKKLDTKPSPGYSYSDMVATWLDKANGQLRYMVAEFDGVVAMRKSKKWDRDCDGAIGRKLHGLIQELRKLEKEYADATSWKTKK